MGIIDSKEAAAVIGVHPSRMRQLASSGRIPALKMGKTWVFDEKDVIAYRDSPRKVGRPKGAS